MSISYKIDQTPYARALGYLGTKLVVVEDGRVTSHRQQNWHDFCEKLRSNADSAQNKAIMDDFKEFAVDHIEWFNAIPCEFEFKDTVYDADWCWDLATRLGLLALLKEDDQ